MCGSTKFSSFDSMRPEAAEASTASVVGSQKAVWRPLLGAAAAALVSLPTRRAIVAAARRKNARSSSSIRLHKSSDQFSKSARNPVFQPHANPVLK